MAARGQVIVTATLRQNKIAKTFRETVRDNTQTEERVIKSVNGDKITLTEPLKFDHVSNGVYRGEVANLSRNVVIESADPKVARGHTMYHYGSAGSISLCGTAASRQGKCAGPLQSALPSGAQQHARKLDHRRLHLG
jgi:hypothetical protein